MRFLAAMERIDFGKCGGYWLAVCRLDSNVWLRINRERTVYQAKNPAIDVVFSWFVQTVAFNHHELYTVSAVDRTPYTHLALCTLSLSYTICTIHGTLYEPEHPIVISLYLSWYSVY